MNVKPIIDFLNELKDNNNREWFLVNKSRYEEARQTMYSMLGQLISEISKFDSSIASVEPKDCLFRIYRDVRFAKDKNPYKTNMGGFIVPGGKNSGNAGYYLHLEPENSFVGGGIYMPEAARLKAIRNEIYYSENEINEIINQKDFKNYFSKISGDALVRPPKGFDPEFKSMELLKLKSYTMIHPIGNNDFNNPHLIQEMAKIFKAMYPLNTFLNRAVQN
ncbi:MAG: DUF2461 domain-containing protein [Bacteroidales bacterium]|nr:DUF2461 domain-containing protein [Bacteroidales bacterium]